MQRILDRSEFNRFRTWRGSISPIGEAKLAESQQQVLVERIYANFRYYQYLAPVTFFRFPDLHDATCNKWVAQLEVEQFSQHTRQGRRARQLLEQLASYNTLSEMRAFLIKREVALHNDSVGQRIDKRQYKPVLRMINDKKRPQPRSKRWVWIQ